MDDEEKLRLLIIIEKIQKKSKVKSAILEQIKQELEEGVHITEEEENYVLELWKKYKNKSSVKKSKPIYKNPMFLVLTIILVITLVTGISLTMIDSRSEPAIIERDESKSGSEKSQSDTPKLLKEPAQKQNEGFFLTDKEEKALRFVQNYRGTDGSGSTINEAIVTIIVVSYGGTEIFDHPKTEYGWSAIKDYFNPGVYDVYFDWISYDGEKTFHFVADSEQNRVWSTDELTSDIIKIVNSEG